MRKVVFIVFTFIFSLFLIIAGILFYHSPGKLEPFRDQNGNPLSGSISEKVFVHIGGVPQGMFIRGKDINNPVLLFVHGGPAFPEYFLFDKYPTGLEDHFTVCYWEQRGGGMSYGQEVTFESMTLEQFADDAIEVTHYLRKRFGKEKIFIMAHSGGTVFAIQAAAFSPHLYYAYIGMAQITRSAESEKLAYKYMWEQYSADGNQKALDELRRYPVLETDSVIIPFFKSMIRDESMHELGIGTTRKMRSVFRDVFIAVWMCKAYTIKEKFNIWISKFSFLKKTSLIEQVFASDITSKVLKLDIPVYFFSGKYDMTVNHSLSKDYLEKLQAPVKGFYLFEKSAHSPIFEEPQKVTEIMIRDVLHAAAATGGSN